MKVNGGFCFQTGKGARTMPNILDDIIASVVENKIPASRQTIGSKIAVKHEPVAVAKAVGNSVSAVAEDAKSDRKKLGAVDPEAPDEPTNLHQAIPFCWLNNKQLLWLKDHRNQSNWKLFRECWRQGQVRSRGRRVHRGVWSCGERLCVSSSPSWCRGSTSV